MPIQPDGLDSQSMAAHDVSGDIVANVDTAGRTCARFIARVEKDAVMRLSQAHVFGKYKHRKVAKQSSPLELTNLLITRSVRNNAEWFPRKSIQTRCGVIVGARQRFVLANKRAVPRIRFIVAQFRRAEYVAHAGTPLVPQRDFSTAEAVEVLVQNLFPGGRKF